MQDSDDTVLIEASPESMIKFRDVLGYSMLRAIENFPQYAHLLQILFHVFLSFYVTIVLLNLGYPFLDGL